MLSNVVVKVLLLVVCMGVVRTSLHERAEELKRNARGAETEDIAIDVLYKLPPSTSGYMTFANVALVTFGFVLGVAIVIAYRQAIPKKCNLISPV